MEESQSIERSYYTSRYFHGIDDKRRVQIPSKWRPAKAGIQLTLVVWLKPKEGPCLRVMPPEKMAKLVRDIEAMPNDDPDKAVLKRFVGSESAQVTLDKVGRITVPEEMAQAAGLEKEAVLVGVLDAYEIWSPERYARVKSADAVMAHEAVKRME